MSREGDVSRGAPECRVLRPHPDQEEPPPAPTWTSAEAPGLREGGSARQPQALPCSPKSPLGWEPEKMFVFRMDLVTPGKELETESDQSTFNSTFRYFHLSQMASSK